MTTIDVCASIHPTGHSIRQLLRFYITLYEAILAAERERRRRSKRFLRTGHGRKKRARASRPILLGFIKWRSKPGKKRNIRAAQSVSPIPYRVLRPLPLWFLISSPLIFRILFFSPFTSEYLPLTANLLFSRFSFLSFSFFMPLLFVSRLLHHLEQCSVATKSTRGRARGGFGCTSGAVVQKI